MMKIKGFGENVEGYKIPVLNEREIRAASGILFVLMFSAILTVILKENFLLLKYAITIFLTDIFIRVFINPKYSPSMILGRIVVQNQTPEYVGAKQKKFAWIIGFSLASIMMVLQVIVNSWSPITGLICMICLIFLFFETAFGICLGCLFYPLFFKEKVELCPGDVCKIKTKEEIQRVSKGQIFVIIFFAIYITLLALTLNDFYKIKPFDLFGITTSHEVQ